MIAPAVIQYALTIRRILVLLATCGRQVRARPFCDGSSLADGLAQGRVWVDGFGQIDRVHAHFDSQHQLANQLARIGADDTATHDTVGFSIEQNLGKAFVAVVGNGTTRGSPWEHALLDLDTVFLGLDRKSLV